jgi:hypothetical protein
LNTLPRTRYNNGSFKWILLIIRCKEKSGKNNNRELDLWSLYLYVLKPPVTREKYQKRLEKFFDFLGVEGKIVEEKSKEFMIR